MLCTRATVGRFSIMYCHDADKTHFVSKVNRIKLPGESVERFCRLLIRIIALILCFIDTG